MIKFLHKFKIGKLPLLFWGYLLIILAIVSPWFLKSGYLFSTDTVWGPVITLDWTNSSFLLNLIIKGLSFIFPVAFLEKIFITAILSLILWGGHRLISLILKFITAAKSRQAGTENIKPGPTAYSPSFIFVLSLFTLFNPFVYDRALYGQFGVLAAYGGLLFVLAHLFRAGQNLDFKYFRRAAVFAAVTLMFALNFIFLLAPFYLLFFLGLYLKRREIKKNPLGRKFWWSLVFSVFIVIVINANWLAAFALDASPSVRFIKQGITRQDLVAFQTVGNGPAETFSNVLLMSGFWGKEQFRYFDLTDAVGWQRNFMFLTPLILYGVWLSFYKRGRLEKFLSAGLIVIFSLAVLLAVGIKAPVSRGLTMFLYDHLPLYKGFREPQKWVAVIIPIYLFYLTLGAARLKTVKPISHNRGLSGLILAALIIMQAPSLFWGFNRQVRSTKYPADWTIANQFLVERSGGGACQDKILFLPWHMYMSFDFTRKIIVNPAPTFFSCPTISGTNMEWGGIYDNSQKAEGGVIGEWLDNKGKEGAPVLLGKSPRYIILAKEVDWVQYYWLNKLNYLKLIKETSTLLIYEIKH